MSARPVSVVVVSRGRPAALSLCLTALTRLDYPNYEIIVVTDPDGAAVLFELGLTETVKLVAFHEANISQARNLGIAQAAGEVVAFIDDDAVAEPLWLDHLVGAFDDPAVAAAGGFVRGRNGISFQWKARGVAQTGAAFDLPVDEQAVTVLTPPAGEAVKTEGTNMAVRRTPLLALGGFDPVYKFYMDETDLNMRLAKAGYRTAIVPLAQVHHAFGPSKRRRADRAVLDLFDVGASTMAFLRRHCPETLWSASLTAVCNQQRSRVLEQMQLGLLEPRDVWRAMKSLDAGIRSQRQCAVAPLLPMATEPQAFLPFQSRKTGGHVELSGRIWQARSLREKAKELTLSGHTVSVFLFTYTGLFHRVRFMPPGYWMQRGGVFGRSDRAQRLFRFCRFRQRARDEALRVAQMRWR